MQTTQSYDHGAISTEELPRVLKRWNWGAFLLNWIWGIGNRCYFGLLTFVPLFGLVVPFVMGAKGNLWAWKAGNWRSLQEFQHAQRRWTRWALLAYAGAAVLAVILGFGLAALLKRSPAYELAYAELAGSPRITDQLGTPIKTGMVMGSTKLSGGGTGEAELSFDVTGPQRKGKAYVHATQQAGEWKVQGLSVLLEDGRRIDMREQSMDAAKDPGPAVDEPEVPPPSAAEPPRLPAMRVHLTHEPVKLRGAVSHEEMESALAAQRGALEPCLEHAVGAAKLTLKLVVAANGSLRASVDRGRGVDAEARACVLQAARGFKLPAPSKGSAVVTQVIAIAP